MSPRQVLPLLLLMANTAQAQLLTFNGDGFEACPRGAVPNSALSLWESTFGSFTTPVKNSIIFFRQGVSVGVRFQAPSAGRSGQLRVSVDQPYVGEALLSISRCHSVYPPNPADCVSAVSVAPLLTWTTDPAGSGCRLEPGVLYYFNTTMGVQTEPGGGQPWCANWLAGPLCFVSFSTTVD